MLDAHRKLAVRTGVEAGERLRGGKRRRLEFTHDYGDKVGKTYGGNVFVDGSGIGDVGEAVLRDRKALSNDGIMMVVITIDAEEARVIAGPDLISRGVFYLPEAGGVLDELRSELKAAIEALSVDALRDVNAVKEHIRSALSARSLLAHEAPPDGHPRSDGGLASANALDDRIGKLRRSGVTAEIGSRDTVVERCEGRGFDGSRRLQRSRLAGIRNHGRRRENHR